MGGFNGSGQFDVEYDLTALQDAGQPASRIDAVYFDDMFDDVAAALEGCLTRNGETGGPTSDFQMNNKKIVSLADGTAQAHAASVSQVTSGRAVWAGELGGTATAITATVTLAPSSPLAGFSFRGVVSAASTGPATLSLNGATALPLRRYDGTEIAANDIVAGQIVEFAFNGSEWRIAGWQLNSFNSIVLNDEDNTSAIVTHQTISRGDGTGAALTLRTTGDEANGFERLTVGVSGIGGVYEIDGATAQFGLIGSAAFKFPVGNTSQRPSSPRAGDARFNSATGKFEGYTGVAWEAFN